MLRYEGEIEWWEKEERKGGKRGMEEELGKAPGPLRAGSDDTSRK